MYDIANYKFTLDSREVAEMVEKDHKNLLRDIKRYMSYLAEINFELSEFFKEITYTDTTGRELPCYEITQKGCEFIAHKMTGRRGALFTAQYINRFHDMDKLLHDIELQQLREENKELKEIKAENEMYKNKIRYFDNAINSFAWKERINQKIKKLSEMTGSSENRILSQFYKIINNETYIKLDSFKLVYLLENNLKECSTFDVIANFESSRDCLETIIDRILELKRS